MPTLDIKQMRQCFPILQQLVRGKPLVYLDNAATTQKPLQVIEALSNYYLNHNANVGRGVYLLAEQATSAYNKVREKIRAFINAPSTEEIIFTPNATFAINLVANCFGRIPAHSGVSAGDRVLISAMEHHSNLVPWQILCEEKNAHLDVIPISDDGLIDLDAYLQLLTPRTKIVAVAHVSNVLGTINPIKEMIASAHQHGIPVLIDGTQAAPHLTIDVQQLDCDFYIFSGHKIYAPTGSGVLYGKKTWLETMPPYQSGGGMVKMVNFTKTTYADLPDKFAAGTPNIGSIIGLGAAIDFLTEIGMDKIASYEKELVNYAWYRLGEIPQLKILGPPNIATAITATASDHQRLHHTTVISFVFPHIHPHDIATVLDDEGIAVRAGNHCAMPLMARLGVPATTRASFAFYNTKEEIDALINGLLKTCSIFG